MRKRLILFALIVLFAAQAFALELPIGVQKLFAYEKQVALSITFLVALAGGLLTFTSPCGFVILPTFFSYVFKDKKRAVFMTSIFSLGMTLAFVIFGVIGGLMGNFFNNYKIFFATLSGVVLIIFGVMLALNKGFSFFDFRIKHTPDHGWNVFLLGFFFAVGWTPCIGPILGGITILIATTGSAIKGALLFATYSLGISIPLMLFSYFSDKQDWAKWFTSRHVELKFGRASVHTHLYGIIGGVVLAAIGSIMFLGGGTSFFMDDIPKYLPWTMTFFSKASAQIIAQETFASDTANILGIVLAIVIFALFFWAMKKPKM